MATVNFTYDYPYAGYGEDGRFQAQWSESRKTLNGCYTYPMVFNTTVPGCKHIKMNVEIENTGSGTVHGRSLYIGKATGGMRYARLLCLMTESTRLTVICPAIP